MTRLTLTLAIVCAIAVTTYAGPEPIAASGKEMKQVVPPPAPSCFNWSGFYVGALGGYKFSSVDLDFDLSGEWDSVPEAQRIGESAGSRDLDNDGAEAGGLIGYNFQWNCWVFGLEASGGYLWARNSHDSGSLFPERSDAARDPSAVLGVDNFHIRSSFQTHYLFTVAPRIGYAFGRCLPYVTGGLAIGDLELDQELDFIGEVRQGGFEGGDHTETNAGWMVGGGLQYALTDHWSVRGQYQYIDLGDIDFESNFPDFTKTDAPAHHHAELREHNASFAIMYRF